MKGRVRIKALIDAWRPKSTGVVLPCASYWRSSITAKMQLTGVELKPNSARSSTWADSIEINRVSHGCKGLPPVWGSLQDEDSCGGGWGGPSSHSLVILLRTNSKSLRPIYWQVCCWSFRSSILCCHWKHFCVHECCSLHMNSEHFPWSVIAQMP